jgi:predicted transcriptional regulator
MRPSHARPGGELEHAVLLALWEMSTASAREIHARVGEPKGLVYTTIATVLDRLHAKGLVARVRSGRAYRYHPSVGREVVERNRLRHILGRVLGTQPRQAIASLIEVMADVDPHLLDELARAINARRRSRRGS